MEGYDDVMDDDSMVPQNVEGSVEKEAGPYFSLYFGVYLYTGSVVAEASKLEVCGTPELQEEQMEGRAQELKHFVNVSQHSYYPSYQPKMYPGQYRLDYVLELFLQHPIL